MKTVILVLIAVIIGASPAFAQDTAIDLSPLIQELMKYGAMLIAVIVAAAVTYGVNLIRRWTGIKIEGNDREALQSALTNAAHLLIGRVLPDGDGVKIETGSTSIATAVNYVLKSVPDAVRRFGLSPEDVEKMLKPKILEMVAADPAVKEVSAASSIDVVKEKPKG